MDSNLLWLLLVVVAVGIGLVYYLVSRKRSPEISSGTVAGHFAELVRKGILIKLNAGEAANIALQNREELLCVFPETTLVEPRAVREWHSAYGGPSIRIAKGLYWRFGASRGHSESHDELRGIDIGTLVLTNERIVFVGSKRSNSVPLEKLISVEGFSDGLVVHREGKEKIEGYLLSSGKQMTYEYEGQTLAAPLDGRLIKHAIDLAIVVHQDAESRANVAVSNGDRLLAQANLAEALKFYRDSFAIREQLLTADPGNTGILRALAVSGERIGNVLKKQRNPDEALKFYRHSFSIGQRLLKTDPGNTDAQRDLSVWNDRIGSVLEEQGNLDEALKFYRNSFAIREGLVKANPSDTEAQRGLFVACANIGDLLKEKENFGEALDSYRYGFAVVERLAKAEPGTWQKDLESAVGKISALSYTTVKARKFSQALDIADQAILRAPDLIWLYINRAHALMFLGQVDEAHAIYLKYRGHQNVQGGETWEAVVLEDFAQLREAGMRQPLMDEVEKVLSSKANFPRRTVA